MNRERLTRHAMAAAVTVLVLAPLAVPGYVLAYDMVFVPHQPLRWDLVAPSGGLPRAVPQDAVVSVLSLVAPGWLLQRVALIGAVYAAALGAARLVPAQRTLTRVVAAVGYAWTPFLAERLLLGQWGLLLAYGALPWLVMAANGVRTKEPGALPRLIVAAAVCSLTPTGGVLALATTFALTISRRRPTAIAAVAVLELPWIVAAATTAASGRSDPAGVAAFAARGENWSGPVGALAGTGGIWNAQTTPASRGSALVPIVTLVLVALAAYGFPRWNDRRLAILAGAGLLVALLGIVRPTADLLAWAVGTVPGAGLFRDGHKFLVPYALLLTGSAALGAERLAAKLAEPRARLVLVAVAVLPVAVLPDLAFGGAGRLRPVDYPADWDRVAAQVAADPGEVLSLPFSEYLAYRWNHDRTVIDPSPRYLAADVLTDDTLRVGDIALHGENPRAAQVRALLAAGEPVSGTGVRWVLVQRAAGGTVPDSALAGLQSVYSGQYLDLYANPAAAPAAEPSDARRWGLAAVHLVAVALVIAALLRLLTRW
jgi:hypothetical protein